MHADWLSREPAPLVKNNELFVPFIQNNLSRSRLTSFYASINDCILVRGSILEIDPPYGFIGWIDFKARQSVQLSRWRSELQQFNSTFESVLTNKQFVLKNTVCCRLMRDSNQGLCNPFFGALNSMMLQHRHPKLMLRVCYIRDAPLEKSCTCKVEIFFFFPRWLIFFLVGKTFICSHMSQTRQTDKDYCCNTSLFYFILRVKGTSTTF